MTMKPSHPYACIRRALPRAALTLALAFTASLALAQGSFPNKPLRMIVGFAAGGPLDVTTRLIAQDMSNDLGQPVIVDNRAGASGQIATDAVARAPADGYTLLSTASTFIVNPLLMAKVNSDPIKDFAPVSHTAVLPTVLVTAPDAKVNSVRDIVNLAKSEQVTYASAGNGGPTHR
jgi:tripartite-type tricarboxylate transporter receptor subunit TctC